MPKFNKFISQSPVDYGAALQISGFHISNENKNAPTLEPFPYNQLSIDYSKYNLDITRHPNKWHGHLNKIWLVQ